MAISVYLGKVTKRKNSTFRPSLTAAVNVVLKEGTSDTRPAFLLNSDEPIDANYLVWGERYYFIDDITYERNNLYTIRCSLDVLATYKSYIAATTAFVAFDSSGNTEIIDPRLSIKTTKTVQANSGGFTYLGQGSCVVVNTVGLNSCVSYGMSASTAAGLLNDVQNWADGVIPDYPASDDIVETVRAFVETFKRTVRQFFSTGKVSDSIRSACVVPYPQAALPALPGGSAEICLGQYHSNKAGVPINTNTTFNDLVELAIPWQSGLGDWRRNAPYTRLYLYCPYFGCVEIPTSEVIGDNTVFVQATIAPATADTIFTVLAGTRTIMQFNAALSSPFAIGSSNVTPAQKMTNFVSVGTSVAAAAATGGVSAWGSVIKQGNGIANNGSSMPTTVGSSCGAAITGVSGFVSLFTVCHDTNVEPGSVAGVMGTPTMAARSLGGLSGYIECREASIAAPAESAILDQINAYVNGGFFME